MSYFGDWFGPCDDPPADEDVAGYFLDWFGVGFVGEWFDPGF